MLDEMGKNRPLYAKNADFIEEFSKEHRMKCETVRRMLFARELFPVFLIITHCV